jgi:xanthine dehydrogenase YagR molybdenum-binding subunit
VAPSAVQGRKQKIARRQTGRQSEASISRFPLGEGVQMDTDGRTSPTAIRVWGAVFVEVGVDRALGLLRLAAECSAYSVVRILNPRTAKSQLVGGLIWGRGSASMFEPRLGRFLWKDLAGPRCR